MIVIFGMAHSGTTIVAHTLRQAPRVHLHTSGEQAGLLECGEIAPHLPVEEWSPKTLRGLQNRLPQDHHLLIKRPWMERYTSFWQEWFPDSYYICLLRPFVEIFNSWTGKRSQCPDMKEKTQAELWPRWEKHLHLALDFPKQLPDCHYLLVDHPRLCRWPNKVMSEIGDFLGLTHTFDVSGIGVNRDIKGDLKKQAPPPRRIVPKRKKRSCCK